MVAAPESAVTKSGSKRLAANAPAANTMKYSPKNAIQDDITAGSSAVVPTGTATTARGFSGCLARSATAFHIASRRTCFMPPAVEPAQPPINRHMKIMPREKCGHSS